MPSGRAYSMWCICVCCVMLHHVLQVLKVLASVNTECKLHEQFGFLDMVMSVPEYANRLFQQMSSDAKIRCCTTLPCVDTVKHMH